MFQPPQVRLGVAIFYALTALFAQAAILWFLAALARTHPASVRPFVLVLLAASAANIYITWRYFFVVPLVMSIAIVLCLALTLKPSRSADA